LALSPSNFTSRPGLGLAVGDRPRVTRVHRDRPTPSPARRRACRPPAVGVLLAGAGDDGVVIGVEAGIFVEHGDGALPGPLLGRQLLQILLLGDRRRAGDVEREMDGRLESAAFGAARFEVGDDRPCGAAAGARR
jgi:hypothetical protein